VRQRNLQKQIVFKKVLGTKYICSNASPH
jgi:hypothetical protein